MSGMLGQLLGGLLGGSGGAQGQSPLATILQQMMAQQGGRGGAGGGLGGLLQQFQQAGLGKQADSWVGTGANEPVTPDQVGQVFTQSQISDWATQAGTTPDAMRDVLAQALPQVVDHLTPGGQVPTQTADVGNTLESIFGQHRRA